MTEYLYDALSRYTGAKGSEEERWGEKAPYPLHMPGHKRRLGGLCDPFRIDITEIDGFDNLHHAEGLLREAQERAADLYESEETHFLVNGSTCGILAAVSAAVTAGRRTGRGGLLMARNCHKAAYHAAYLNRLDPVWLIPRPVRTEQGTESVRVIAGGMQTAHEEAGFPQEYGNDPGIYLGGRIDPEEVDWELAAHPECAAVLIVSPTYDGVISDVRKIARIAHRHKAVLIVDEAHGAHYGLHETQPASSVQLGADLVIHSLHKTLPSLTQTALLHVNGTLVDRELVHRFLQIYQTSSPSYVLMASMDECVRLLSAHAERYFSDLDGMLERFYESVRDLRTLQVVRPDDPSKILIFPEDRLSGGEICAMLRNAYGLEAEMALPAYVLALMSIGDDEEGLVRLSNALHEIDEERFIRQRFGHGIGPIDPDAAAQALQMPSAAKRVISLHAAWDAACESVPLAESEGRIAGEMVYLYPPGIPAIVPGERIGAAHAVWMRACLLAGYELHGMEDETGRMIRVTAEPDRQQ